MFKPTYILFCLAVFLCGAPLLMAQDIRINEVVSSNSEYPDEDGDTPDWIELHNYGSVPVSLLNWSLTNDGEELDKWQFPDITLQPDEYLLIWASSKDRKEVSYPRTLINKGDTHNYLIPTSEPPSNWKNLGFDDASWTQGASGFGYGDNDDATTVASGTKSIFTRTSFSVTNLSDVKSLVLDVDYDDAFVAYINGTEVARANINGTPPPFDFGAATNHEAQIFKGGKPTRYIIENPRDILAEGENILAIQTHNTNNTSSDLTIIPFLSALYGASSTMGVDSPEILGLSTHNMHTNFKISSTSETIILSDSLNNIVSQLLVEGLRTNTSIGHSTTTGNLVFFLDTTPGAVNSSTSYSGILTSTDIEFSHEGGLVSESSINLVLSGNTGSQTIRYTLDATEPTETSLLYSSPIAISNNTVVRARLFDTGNIPSYSVSKSYIFGANHEIDVVFLTTDSDNLFSKETGISHKENRGRWWERPIHFSFWDKDTQQVEVEFNAGIKTYGGASRYHNKQSPYSIIARSKYGTSKIEYPFFDTLDYDVFKSLVLRNSGNNWMVTSIKDAALTSLMEGSGLDFQAFNPVATYINGQYWGMYNIREKITEHTLATRHGIDADDINLLEKQAEISTEIKNGTNKGYLELIDYIKTTNLASDSNFEYVANRVDLDNYALYQVTQLYINNRDWPGNNIKFWNHPDGKWKWFLYDTDAGFGSPWTRRHNTYDENTFHLALATNGPRWPNPPWSTLLFRKMLTNVSFRNRFINRYADELNTRFLPENVKEHIENVYRMVQPEINAHYARWRGDSNKEINYKNQMKIFADRRPAYVKEHIRSQFNLPGYHTITINNTDVSQGHVKVNNNLIVQETSWNGDYFETVPIKLTAIPEPGHVFSHWEGASNSTNAEIEIDLQDATEITPFFIAAAPYDPLVINEINYKSGSESDSGDWIELYNPSNEPMDLSNWMLKDSKDKKAFTFPEGTSIAAQGYLVVTKNREAFMVAHPMVTNIVGDFDFGLGSSDAVRLFDPNSILNDEVHYTSEQPWPTCANGTGATIELISPDLDNALPENWECTNIMGTPGLASYGEWEENIGDDKEPDMEDGNPEEIIEEEPEEDWKGQDSEIEVDEPENHDGDIPEEEENGPEEMEDGKEEHQSGEEEEGEKPEEEKEDGAGMEEDVLETEDEPKDEKGEETSVEEGVSETEEEENEPEVEGDDEENQPVEEQEDEGQSAEEDVPEEEQEDETDIEDTSETENDEEQEVEENQPEEENGESEETSKITMYPIPTQDILRINASGHFIINIYDVGGHKVYSCSDSKEMDVSMLTAGVYTVEYISVDKKVYQKIIVN